MSDGDSRVEPRGFLIGRGMGVTPEKIEELQQQQLKSQRSNRPPPEKKFSEVFNTAMQKRIEEKEVLETEELEKRPSGNIAKSVMTDYQREMYGVEQETDADNDKIILKG